MKTKVLPAALVLTLALSTPILAESQAVTPKLAPGVKAQAGYEASAERLLVANPTPIFSDILSTAPQTGQLDRIGEPVNVLAKVKDWDWVLVGRDGTGIGYVPTDLLIPAAHAKPVAKKTS